MLSSIPLTARPIRFAQGDFARQCTVKQAQYLATAHRADIKVVADSAAVVEGLSSAMSRAGLTLPVLSLT